SQKILAVCVQHTVLLQICNAEGAVQLSQARKLQLPARADPLAPGLDLLHPALDILSPASQLLMGNAWHLHEKIDPVQKGTRDLLQIALHPLRRAAASPERIPEIAAGAGVHRRHQLETGRILQAIVRTADRDGA